MLILQASKSFELWTGEQMPVEQVKKFLIQKLKSKRRKK
jgi:shikimate 5-dehydrogenase